MGLQFPTLPGLLVALETAQDWSRGEQIYSNSLQFKGHDAKQGKEECPEGLTVVLK